jgi:hypothetical protein
MTEDEVEIAGKARVCMGREQRSFECQTWRRHFLPICVTRMIRETKSPAALVGIKNERLSYENKKYKKA